MFKPLLHIRNLQAGFLQGEREIPAVHGMNLMVYRGETVALVGESGCGKSLTALSIMGLLGSRAMPRTYVKGSMQLQTTGHQVIELVGLPTRQYDELRGSILSMIFQEPMSALNPLLSIGEQIAEMLMKHKGVKRPAALDKARELLESVGIAEASRRMKSYPFQLSGGQLQRVMIAIAMSCHPALLIADEPTTALDVTIQSQILYLLKQMKETHGTSILFITHNLGIVAQFADRVAVMYRGIIVEYATVEQLFRTPRHPYTQMLLRSLPTKGARAMDGSRLQVIDGTVPGPSIHVSGCPFHTRCPAVMPSCTSKLPDEVHFGDGHTVRCLLAEEELGNEA